MQRQTDIKNNPSAYGLYKHPVHLTANTVMYAYWRSTGGTVTFTQMGTYRRGGYPGKILWITYGTESIYNPEHTGWLNPVGTNSGTAVTANPSSGMIRVKCNQAISSMTVTFDYWCNSLDALCTIQLFLSKNLQTTHQFVYTQGDIGYSTSGSVNYTFKNLAAGDLIGVAGWAGSDSSSRQWGITISNAKFTYTI